jgi:hypothetical protein
METSVNQPLPADVFKPNRRSSCQTVSTDSNTSDDITHSHIKGKSLAKGRRRTSKKSNNSRRELIMNMVAQEMASPCEDVHENIASQDSSSPSRTMADIFYAQMNGEEIDAPYRDSIEELPVDDDIEDDEVCAVGALTLPDDGMMSSSRRRSSAESTSKASRSTHPRSSSKSSASSDANDEDTLPMPMDEIQKCVMENMPDEVKNKIPKESSGQIFARIGVDVTKEPFNGDIIAQEEDDATVFSEITEYTGCRKEIVNNRKAAPFAPEDGKWDEELCPTINKGSSQTVQSHDSHDTLPSCSRAAVSFRTDATGSINATKVTGVKFNSVEVRYYERILDINPSVTSGAAIGIGWRYKQGGRLSVDDWELHRAGARHSSDLVLPRHVREGIFKNLGYTQTDIAEATRIVLKAKNRRKTTVQNLGSQHMEEAVESASRRVKDILSFGSKKRLVKA